MKVTKTLFALLATGIIFSFCACGDDNTDKASETANINSSVTSEIKSNTSSAPDTSDTASSPSTSDILDNTENNGILPQEYTTIIEDYISAFPWFDGIDQVNVPHGGSDLYRYHNNLSEVGYALADINGDGQAELLLAGINADCVYDMYTIKNGETVHVFSGAERCDYNLYETGIIELSWADSAFVSGYDYYTLENGELKLVETVVFDAEYAEEIGLINDVIGDEDDNDCHFKSNTETKEDYIHITDQEAKEIVQSYRDNGLIKINYTPLSEFCK